MSVVKIDIESENVLREKMEKVWSMACRGIKAGPILLTLGRPEEKRSNPQNQKIHCIFVDLCSQGAISMPGRRVDLGQYGPDGVKALCVMWFANEREIEGRPLSKPPRTIVDPTTGRAITVRPSTVDFGKRDMSEFIEWLHALGADCGVMWGDPALAAFESYREAQQ